MESMVLGECSISLIFQVLIKIIFCLEFFIVFFNECCLIENARKYYKIDREVLFNIVSGTLLIQYLNACKSLILLFYPKLQYQAISFFVFRCKSVNNCKDG